MISQTPPIAKKMTLIDWPLLFISMIGVPLMLVRVLLHSYNAINGLPNNLAVGSFWLLVMAFFLNKELKKAKETGGHAKTIKIMWIIASVISFILISSVAYLVFASSQPKVKAVTVNPFNVPTLPPLSEERQEVVNEKEPGMSSDSTARLSDDAYNRMKMEIEGLKVKMQTQDDTPAVSSSINCISSYGGGAIYTSCH